MVLALKWLSRISSLLIQLEDARGTKKNVKKASQLCLRVMIRVRDNEIGLSVGCAFAVEANAANGY
jgi:hypothetical protein